MNLLGMGDIELLRNYFAVKNVAAEHLKEVLKSSTMNELLILEVLLYEGLRRSMIENNLDKMNMMLFKISPEGQTYKIYEIVPILIMKTPAFYQMLGRYTRYPDKVCEVLSHALRPGGSMLNALRSFGLRRGKFEEADLVLRGVQSLYRFIVLGDSQGLLDFLNYLRCSYELLEGEKAKGKNKRRMKEYLYILREMEYALRG